jgi:integrase
VDAVPRRKEPERHIRFLTLPQIDEQLRVLAGRPVVQALVATYIYAGLRREEALWLAPEDVDLKAGMIRVRQKVVNGESWQPKTRRNRRVPISSMLRIYLEACQPADDSVWFFPSPTGRRWDPDNFSQDLREINGVHGLPWACLDFRHTFGSHLAQKGESLYKIAELMGNSPEICRRHYAALIPEQMRDSVEFDPRPRLVGVGGDGANGAFDVA